MKGSLIKIAVFLGVLMFLAISSLGVLHLGMTTGPAGQMSDCPFTPGVSICAMTSFGHISATQNLFTFLPLWKNILALFGLLILAVVVLVPVVWKSIWPPRGYLPPPSFLQVALAQGILNSKAF